MRTKHIMFLGLILAAGTTISLTFAGLWLGDEEVELSNALTVFKQATILGVWSVTVPNVSFFLVGARALIMMDFAFFQGSAGLFVQWVLYLVIGTATLWGLFSLMIGVVQGRFSR
ncbi:MAG: hypothetical protein A2Z70_01365 [Chloroflexi bacterium RBG_13_48_17]|nr:MAG: hypothetical protein A2Z70_01365 [Chloroflexi bacterium RBG_13_48_17]